MTVCSLTVSLQLSAVVGHAGSTRTHARTHTHTHTVSVWSVCFDWREACLLSWCNRKHDGRVSQRYRFESRRGQWALFFLIPSALSFVFLWHTHTHTHARARAHVYAYTRNKTRNKWNAGSLLENPLIDSANFYLCNALCICCRREVDCRRTGLFNPSWLRRLPSATSKSSNYHTELFRALFFQVNEYTKTITGHKLRHERLFLRRPLHEDIGQCLYMRFLLRGVVSGQWHTLMWKAAQASVLYDAQL